MTRMFDLGDVFQLINDAFNNRSTSQQDAIGHEHQLVSHILAQLGNELDVKHFSQSLGQILGDVAFISEELTEQSLDQTWNRLAVINIARRDAELQELAAIIDHQVQLEAKEPAHRRLSTSCQSLKYFVAVDALVEAHI